MQMVCAPAPIPYNAGHGGRKIMHIEIFFDTICPWSYIAIRRLNEALRANPQGNLQTIWSPFLLNPQMPPGGAGRQSYLISKFGAMERVNRALEHLAPMGREVGIEFDFGSIDRTPNTILAHRLIRRADQVDLGPAAVDALFSAFFEQGLDTGKPEVLIAIGRDLGLGEDALVAYLADMEDREKILGQFARARRLGIRTVPSFIFDGRFSISGAQDSSIFARMFEVAQEGREEFLPGTGEAV